MGKSSVGRRRGFGRTAYKYPMIFVPQIVWAIHAKQTISVLRRSVPLNKSIQRVPEVISFSISLVCSITEKCQYASNGITL